MKKIILVLLYIFLLLYLFFGVSDNVIYSHSGPTWLLFLLAFPAQAFLVYLIARSFSLKPYTSKGVAALAILVSCPLFGIYLKKNRVISYQSATHYISCIFRITQITA